MINYIVKCQNCNWKSTLRDKQDFSDLKPVANGCSKCSGKKFKCPQCGRYARMHKVLVK
jgi:hypothetical protein